MFVTMLEIGISSVFDLVRTISSAQVVVVGEIEVVDIVNEIPGVSVYAGRTC